MTKDPEYAEWVLSLPESSDVPRNPRLSEWTPEVAALTDIKDRLAELIVTMIRLTPGARAADPRPSPRPTTAIDKKREEARLQRHLSLVEEVQAAQARWAQQNRG